MRSLGGAAASAATGELKSARQPASHLDSVQFAGCKPLAGMPQDATPS